MFTVSLDVAKNSIHFTSMKTCTHEDAEKCVFTAAAELKRLKPSFTVLTDLTCADNIDLSYVPYIERIMDLCNQAGVGRIIRIIPDPSNDIGFNILSRFHHRKEVHIITCKTMDEAMQYTE